MQRGKACCCASECTQIEAGPAVCFLFMGRRVVSIPVKYIRESSIIRFVEKVENISPLNCNNVYFRHILKVESSEYLFCAFKRELMHDMEIGFFWILMKMGGLKGL